MSFRVSYLCTDCGLYLHPSRRNDPWEHREQSGHTRVIALAADRRSERARAKARRQEARRPTTSAYRPVVDPSLPLEERLAAIFGGPR